MVQGRYPIPAKYGERVRFHRRGGGIVPQMEGEGVFVLAWLGEEECWEVQVGDSRVALYPCFGDSMEPVDGPA